MVGDLVGAEVGDLVGDLVGVVVGDLVGDLVGAMVGGVGAGVGVEVGAGVGVLVGGGVWQELVSIWVFHFGSVMSPQFQALAQTVWNLHGRLWGLASICKPLHRPMQAKPT